MDFEIPEIIVRKLGQLDRFIEAEIRPLEAADDNIRFFDHRREHARTDWDAGGTPRAEWEALLAEMRRRADAAGHYRYGLPREFGGEDAGNLAMAVVREHLASLGLGLHNDLQNESSIVGNLPIVLMLRDFGTAEQVERYVEPAIRGEHHIAFGLTEPLHGSDATWMKTRAVRSTRRGEPGWIIDGEKMWNTGMHVAGTDLVFARSSGEDGQAAGITCFLVPADASGVRIEEYLWTFNMPTDHPRVSFTGVWVGEDAVLGQVGRGLEVAQHFVHENRIRQAASSLGAAVYCIGRAVGRARDRKPFGRPLATNQGIQFPLVELATEAEMLRLLIHRTAWQMDRLDRRSISRRLSDKVAMCNYRANRLCCEAADRAMQVFGGIGYSRHEPFEHIYRHHRRYRITEGAEEIQMRKVAGHLFGFIGG